MVRDDCQPLSDLVNESLFTKVASCEKRNWQACSDIICVPDKPHNRRLEDLGCVKASLKNKFLGSFRYEKEGALSPISEV